MLEAAIAAVVTALVMLLPLRLVDIRRVRAWAGRDDAREETVAYIAEGEALVAEVRSNAEAVFTDLEHKHTDAEAALVEGHANGLEALMQTHDGLVTILKAEHAEFRETAQGVNSSLLENVAQLRGQVIGLNEAHAETKEVADRILRDHDWHIAGKGDPHGRGVMVLWQCSGCQAMTYAPEGSL